MRGSFTLIIGAAMTLCFAIAALVSFIWVPFDVTLVDIPNKFQRSNGQHWLGTDHFGRDLLSMIMVGARTSIAVALIAVGIGILIGVPLGLLAAVRKNSWLDEMIMRANDLIFAFPSLVIAILITAIFGAGAVNAIIAIGIFNIPVFARVTRGGALSLWEREFILSARVAGKSGLLISVERMLPHLANLLIVQGTIQFSLGILAEAGLSYVGLGAQPPLPEWGAMISDGRQYLLDQWWVPTIPGIAILVVSMGFNLLGDGLRDVLDPRSGNG